MSRSVIFVPMTKGGPGWRVRERWYAATLGVAYRYSRTNRSCGQGPAHQDMKMGLVHRGDLVLTCRARPFPSGFRLLPEWNHSSA